MKRSFLSPLGRGLLAALAGALVLTGCSSSTDGGGSGGGDGASSQAAADAMTAVDAAYEGTSTQPPTDAPAVAEGKTVWVLSAFQQVANLAYLTDSTVEAAQSLGWGTEVCDGQNNTDGAWAKCVRQAVAAGADAIVLESIDCAPVAQALAEAKAAGVLIASLTSFDCDDPTQGGGQPMFDVTVPFVGGATIAESYQKSGQLRADWVVAQTGGAAKVVHVEFRGVAFGEYLADAFNERIAECSGCEIVGTVVITPADIPVLRQKFETAMLQHPEANAVAVDVDFMLQAGIQQALTTSATTDLAVAGGECSRDSVGYLHTGGGIEMCVGQSLGWLSYAGVDGLVRAFAGEQVVDSGLGEQLVDAENNLPAEGEWYTGPVDYAADYRAAWGV
ncbi:ribose transport system substrate-binding protein [Klenkia marina]|uniref:Ribose transport system substrate-binding protein n=1 Tax=Klenkia marina TaxID=1960309 RepID=A0A1G4XGU9_9ACTN|nr:substrate-binding domain-containing protein [Klenkia marina]SCX40440.1 ribose transport system substrate-binding protein [Klenkia marina]